MGTYNTSQKAIQMYFLYKVEKNVEELNINSALSAKWKRSMKIFC